MHKQKIALFLGNIVDHYDTALFAFLSPLFGKLFFPQATPETQLVYTYLLFFIAMFARPLGAYLFGIWGDKLGQNRALSFALIGMGFSSIFIAFIPTYSTLGAFSFILLLLGRASQNFFSSGETITSAFCAVEGSDNEDLMSGLLSASTVLGILLSAFATTLLFYFQVEEHMWRILYLIGGACSITGWILKGERIEIQKAKEKENKPTVIAFLTVAAAAGFSYSIYMYSFVILRGFIPLVSEVSEVQISWISTECLILDLLLLLLFGWVAKIIGRDRLMILSALAGPLLCLALVSALKGGAVNIAFLYLGLAVIIGTSYSAPLFAWMSQVLPEGKKGRYGSLAYSLGTQLIGGPAGVFSLSLYNYTEIPESITFYLVGCGFLAGFLQLYLIRGKLTHFSRKLEIPFPLSLKTSKLPF